MWSCTEINVFFATQALNASSLRGVREGAEQDADVRLTMQKIQDLFEGVGPYGQLKLEEPSPSLQPTASESCGFVLRHRDVEVVVA